jgi:[glutamine synthetase] adenylyltransferase / [glutamine synthetase]-adenylyl-L-tyrosine phosphorylase
MSQAPHHTTALAEHSRLVQRLRRRYGDWLAHLPPGAPVADTMAVAYARLRAQAGLDVPEALRCLRQCVMERLVVLDTEQGADLAVVTRAMTELAEFSLDVACQVAFEQLDALHGMPLKANGTRCPFWVVGMGKLGARELNVSSDIDLIYVYEDDGETTGREDGRGQIDHQGYFSKAVKLIYTLIGDTQAHGFVFRMDLALRPNGMSGPPVVSL